jgi:hypothetical protein
MGLCSFDIKTRQTDTRNPAFVGVEIGDPNVKNRPEEAHATRADALRLDGLNFRF